MLASTTGHRLRHRAVSNLNLPPAAANNLRVTLTLPSAAGNTLQGKTSVIDYAFTGTQRDAHQPLIQHR